MRHLGLKRRLLGIKRRPLWTKLLQMLTAKGNARFRNLMADDLGVIRGVIT